MIKLSWSMHSWPLKRPFSISRGTRDAAEVFVIELRDGEGNIGRGEGVPYNRYNEGPLTVRDELMDLPRALDDHFDFDEIPDIARYHCVRNALDCALWELRARQEGRSVWELIKFDGRAEPVLTACTVSLADAAAMAREAREHSARGMELLKVKLGSGDLEADARRLAAVREAVPQARLIVDANEGWPIKGLERMLQRCADLGVELVEQPVSTVDSDALFYIDIPENLIICADESARTADDLDHLPTYVYRAVNIKLDKAGGLTPALEMIWRAQDRGLKIMVGCMLGSSLSMAPAFLIAQVAQWVDLDAPLLLAADEQPSIHYEGPWMQPPNPFLWAAVG